MPKMGDAMEEGTLLKWLKSEGDDVSEGDPIAEIEAEDEGTLAQLIAGEGQEVPVGEAIAFIQGEGEEVPERSEGGGEEEAEEGGEEDGGGAQATATETEAPEEAEEEQADGRADGHFRASPIVRRLADENDLDLSKIDGSGPAGRIVERDVRAAMESGTAQRTEEGAEQADGQAQPEQAAQQGFQPAHVPEPTEA